MLLLPESPLLFMGQEWAASTPFLYFTDHNPELGKLVTEGRRREFSRFAEFSSPESNASIPNPQEVSTFESCRLIWEERGRQPHSCILRLYQRLINLRRSEPSLRSQGCSGELEIEALDESVLVLRRTATTGETTLAVFRLGGDGAVDLREHRLALLSPNMAWEVRLQTEDPSFAADAVPLVVNTAVPAMDFKRPGAVIFHAVERRRA
jgi:maltooligosyltrehalose trehalohydrolase